MDEGEVIGLGQFVGMRGRFGQTGAVQDHPGAEVPGVGDLHERRCLRHDDGGRDAETLGVVGDAEGMVAGRHGDHAAAALVGRERQQLDQRAAFLEGSGVLKVLHLQEQLRVAAQLGEQPAVGHRRADDRAGQRGGRRSHIIECRAQGPDLLEARG